MAKSSCKLNEVAKLPAYRRALGIYSIPENEVKLARGNEKL